MGEFGNAGYEIWIAQNVPRIGSDMAHIVSQLGNQVRKLQLSKRANQSVWTGKDRYVRRNKVRGLIREYGNDES